MRISDWSSDVCSSDLPDQGRRAELRVALKHRSCVWTVTAISSARFDEDDPDLPPMDPAILEHFGKVAQLDWHERDAAVAFAMEQFRISAGPAAAVDEDRARNLAERDYDRALNPPDRKSGVEGKRESVRVELGGSRGNKKKKN